MQWVEEATGRAPAERARGLGSGGETKSQAVLTAGHHPH